VSARRSRHSAYNADRLIKTVLANGLTIEAVYDAASQLSSLTYKKADGSLGGAATASFSYDPLGRRTGKTLNGTQITGYLCNGYDSANFVQELGEANTTQSGTDAPQATLIANLLTAGIDQTQLRQRLTASGTTITASNAEHFLTDANNNTLALADATQTLSTRYSYDVYGQTTQTTQTTLSGTPSDNSQQYTGRENDGTGLYYYRARYYHAGCARFISEDPIGWASGQTNNYAYVGGDPISFTDPEGMKGAAGGKGGQGKSTPRAPTRPDGKPWGAGCGDKGSDHYVPDLFPKSCATHDSCYSTCGKTQQQCDNDFLKDMKAERPDLPSVAPWVYYQAVAELGTPAYSEAQKQCR
jgi:RHS repeat-associated protein